MTDWAAVRGRQFPGAAKHTSYLNTAVSGLMSAAAAEASSAATQEWIDNAAAAVYDPDGKLDEAREGLAAMMNCDIGEVAITGNTTDGLNIACGLLDTDAIAVLAAHNVPAASGLCLRTTGPACASRRHI